MTLIDRHKEAIEALCKKHGVSSLYVFGSVLSDNFGIDSDIDLLVNFSGINLQDFADNYYGLKFALEEIFDRPVDLIEEKALRNPYLKRSIVAHRHLLYAA